MKATYNGESYHTIVVLNDGGTFTNLEGCKLVRLTDDEREMFEEGELDLGSLQEGQVMDLESIVKEALDE